MPAELPEGIQNAFANEEDRARLSATGIKAFRNLARRWELNDADAAALISVSSTTWDLIQAEQWSGILSQEQLTRVSVLVGIFTSLHELIINNLSDRWLTLPNKGPLFDGLSPVAAMIKRGIPCMLETRSHVEAMQMGL